MHRALHQPIQSRGIRRITMLCTVVAPLLAAIAFLSVLPAVAESEEMTASSSGVKIEYPVPNAPTNIAVEAPGRIWFTAPEMEAYLFSDPADNRSIYVAWLNPLDSTEIESLRLPFDNGTVWNIYGHATEVVDIDDGSNDDRIKIQVTSEPVYIIVNH